MQRAQPRHGDPDQGSQDDDGEQVETLRPVESRDEVLCQDIVHDRGLDFHTGIHGAEGCAPQVMSAHGSGPNQHDLVGTGPFGDLAAENIADGNMRKCVRWAEVVDEQLPALVGGDEPVAHLDSIHPMAADLHRETRPSQVVPSAQDRERREEVLTGLDDQGHPSKDTIRITAQTEVPGRGGDVTEDVEVALRSVGPDEWQRARVRRLVGDQRVL